MWHFGNYAHNLLILSSLLDAAMKIITCNTDNTFRRKQTKLILRYLNVKIEF